MFFFLVRLREYKSGRDNQQHSRLRSVTRSSNHCPTSYHPSTPSSSLFRIHLSSFPFTLPLPHSSSLYPSHPSSFPFILSLPQSPFLAPIHPSSSPFTILLTIKLHYSLLSASTTTTCFLEKNSIFFISHSRNIGCENSHTCFFSSFDCANINRDVITNSIADFGP